MTKSSFLLYYVSLYLRKEYVPTPLGIFFSALGWGDDTMDFNITNFNDSVTLLCGTLCLHYLMSVFVSISSCSHHASQTIESKALLGLKASGEFSSSRFLSGCHNSSNSDRSFMLSLTRRP